MGALLHPTALHLLFPSSETPAKLPLSILIKQVPGNDVWSQHGCRKKFTFMWNLSIQGTHPKGPHECRIGISWVLLSASYLKEATPS